MLKFGLIGFSTLTSYYSLCQYTDYFKSTLFFRISRTAFTVTSMIFDYKWFFNKNFKTEEEYLQNLSEVHLNAAKRMLGLTLKNGGVFIKIGQHVGSLSYLLPDEYVSTLKVLHADVPNEPFYKVYDAIKEQLNQEPNEVFSEISEKPLGTASLAQVHWGRLKSTGKEVAIKVQHSDVRHHSSVDIKCMELFFALVIRVFPQMKLEWIAEETKHNLPQELDFINEGRNAEKLDELVSSKLKFLKIPKIYWKHSTDKLLVMEYCHGNKIIDKDYLKQNNISPEKVSQNLCKMYCEMIFQHGYVHCDPHPGNILVRPRTDVHEPSFLIKLWHRLVGKKPSTPGEIVLLDHGLYQTLSSEFLQHYCELWLGMIYQDEKTIEKEGRQLNCPPQLHRLLACMVSGRSWKALSAGLNNQEYSIAERQHVQDNVNTYLPEMISVLNAIPREMLLILKTNDLLRGVENSLLGKPYSQATMGIWTTTKYCLCRSTTDRINQLNLSYDYNPLTRIIYHSRILLRYYFSTIIIFVGQYFF